MKKILLKIILMIIAIITIFNADVYAVSLNIKKINDNSVNISLQTEERNC